MRTKLPATRWAAAVPPGMRALPRWVGWRLSEPDAGGRRTKRPVQVLGGLAQGAARVNDPGTWGTFEDALTFYQKHEADPDAGAGFVFAEGDGLVFMDLDHSLKDGRLKDWALSLAEALAASTYVEVSPSGEGLHAFAVGKLSRAESVTGARVQLGDGAVEAYADRRFSTVTGVRWPRGQRGLGEFPDVLPALLKERLARTTVLAQQGPEPPERRLEVWEALQSVDPDIGHDDWVRVGMALRAAFGDAGLPLWVKWSSRGKKWRRGEPEQRWRSFKRSGVGLGTLFRIARANGWAPPREGPEEAFADFAALKSEFWTVPLSEVREEELEWLVRDLGLVRGYASMVAGDPGRGKSMLTLDVAARLSSGRAMPWERRPSRPPSRVFYLNAEDGAGDTIKPRARAAGADMSRIEVLDVSGGSRVPQLPEDAPAFERMLADLGDAQLVVVDPLNAFLGRDVDAHKAHDVRQALQPLADLLKRSRQAVALVAHLNKNEAVSALYRVSGSADQVAFVRTAVLVGADPDDDGDGPDSGRRVVAPLKWNLGPQPPARAFRIVGAGGEAGRLEWAGEASARAEDLVRRREGGGGGARVNEAAEWLRSRLSAAPAPSRVLESDATAAGITARTLNRAASRLGIKRERDAVTGGWRWPQVGP